MASTATRQPPRSMGEGAGNSLSPAPQVGGPCVARCPRTPRPSYLRSPNRRGPGPRQPSFRSRAAPAPLRSFRGLRAGAQVHRIRRGTGFPRAGGDSHDPSLPSGGSGSGARRITSRSAARVPWREGSQRRRPGRSSKGLSDHIRSSVEEMSCPLLPGARPPLPCSTTPGLLSSDLMGGPYMTYLRGGGKPNRLGPVGKRVAPHGGTGGPWSQHAARKHRLSLARGVPLPARGREGPLGGEDRPTPVTRLRAGRPTPLPPQRERSRSRGSARTRWQGRLVPFGPA